MSPTASPETRGEWLFRQMHALYGARFVAMWRNVDTDDLMRVWTHALAGMPPESLQAGVVALQAVPHPPTLPEFLDLCEQERLRNATTRTPWLPPARRADTAVVDANLDRMKATLAPLAKREASPQWAFDLLLRRRAKNGTPLAQEALRDASDAITSATGRAWYAHATPAQRAQYRTVFDAALHARGEAPPSREPGEDDEEPEEQSA